MPLERFETQFYADNNFGGHSLLVEWLLLGHGSSHENRFNK